MFRTNLIVTPINLFIMVNYNKEGNKYILYKFT